MKAKLFDLICSMTFGRERDETRPMSEGMHGALALVGAWSCVDDEVFDEIVADIYTAREADLGRQVDQIG